MTDCGAQIERYAKEFGLLLMSLKREFNCGTKKKLQVVT